MIRRSTGSRAGRRSNARSVAGPSADNGQSEELSVLFDHLVRSRDRLADLPPLTPQDLERVDRARHEVRFYLLSPPLHVRAELPASDERRVGLVAALHNREADLFAALVGLVAQKLALAPIGQRQADVLSGLTDALDAITFDYRRPKRDTLTMLRRLREDLEGRLGYVKGLRPSGYRFASKPELYRDRRDKAERPDRFFDRVYRPHVPRGLTQADIRLVDPAYYNVLHVWCSRHGRSMASLVPASRNQR